MMLRGGHVLVALLALSTAPALVAQGLTPGDCIITGLCGINPPPPGPPSGLMFVAVGLIIGGVLGIRYRHRS